MSKLPSSFKQYFWDVDFDKLDKETHVFLVIKRVLDRGNTQDIKWLIKNYGFKEIKKVVLSTKDLSRVTGFLWADVLGLSYQNLPCLLKPYSPIHFGLFS